MNLARQFIIMGNIIILIICLLLFPIVITAIAIDLAHIYYVFSGPYYAIGAIVRLTLFCLMCLLAAHGWRKSNLISASLFLFFALIFAGYGVTIIRQIN